MKKITITLPVLSKMKLLALILALLIVAIFLIGNRYLELSQQARYNKITAQWTTFEDSIFRFSLKYPKEWSFYDNEAETALSKPNDSEFILHMSPSDIAQNEVGLDQVIFVFAYHVDPKTDLFSWVKQNGYGKGLFPDSYYRVRKINGYEAVRFEFIQTKPLKDYLISKQPKLKKLEEAIPLGYKAISLYIKKDDLIIALQTGSTAKTPDFVNTFEAAVSTFKFM